VPALFGLVIFAYVLFVWVPGQGPSEGGLAYSQTLSRADDYPGHMWIGIAETLERRVKKRKSKSKRNLPTHTVYRLSLPFSARLFPGRSATGPGV